MLHITNGDDAAERIAAAGLGGAVLPWRDVLHEGPVPAALTPAALREQRARFIASRSWGTYEGVLRDMQQRDEVLSGLDVFSEIVLWFEHDLYDQLQLLQIVGMLSELRPGGAAISLINIDRYPGVRDFTGLGQLTPAAMRELFPARTPLTVQQLALGKRAWHAFGGPDPIAIEAMLEEDLTALPFVRAALIRHLEQFPDVASGLSRSERQVLQVLAEGSRTAAETFAAEQRLEDAVFMADTVFCWLLRDIGRGDARLVEMDGAEVPDPSNVDDADFFARRIAITAAGVEVLRGHRDRTQLVGLDRWLGGVHLEAPGVAWRWDANAQRLAER